MTASGEGLNQVAQDRLIVRNRVTTSFLTVVAFGLPIVVFLWDPMVFWAPWASDGPDGPAWAAVPTVTLALVSAYAAAGSLVRIDAYMADRMLALINVFRTVRIPFELVQAVDSATTRPKVVLRSGKKVTSAVDIWPKRWFTGRQNHVERALDELNDALGQHRREHVGRTCTTSIRRPTSAERLLWVFWGLYLALTLAKVLSG